LPGCNHLQHDFKVNLICLIDQKPQDIIDQGLAVFGGQLQDFEILLICPLGAILIPQEIIGNSKLAGGKKVIFIPVVLKGPGLADQPVYNVPVVDAVAVFAS